MRTKLSFLALILVALGTSGCLQYLGETLYVEEYEWQKLREIDFPRRVKAIVWANGARLDELHSLKWGAWQVRMDPPGAEARGCHPDDRKQYRGPDDPSAGSSGYMRVQGNLMAQNPIEGVHECCFAFDWSYPGAPFKYITHSGGYRTYPGDVTCHLVIERCCAVKIDLPVRIEWGF